MAQKTGKSEGDLIRVGNRDFRVRGVIETTAAVEDIAVFITLSVLQEMTGREGEINEIRLFPESASSLERLRALLKSFSVPVEIIDSSRGEVAERQVETTLRRYQNLLYAISFVLIAFCIAISTYINLEGRKKELSTIYTLGVTKGIIFHLIISRTVWIALMGALCGNLIALFVTMLQGHQIPVREIISFETLELTVFMTFLIGVGVSIPFSLYAVFRQNLVEYLS